MFRHAAVDEIPQKKYLLHMPCEEFSQVRAITRVKLFSFPQLSTQAVHKLCRLVHRLSTGSPGGGLCGGAGGR